MLKFFKFEKAFLIKYKNLVKNIFIYIWLKIKINIKESVYLKI